MQTEKVRRKWKRYATPLLLGWLLLVFLVRCSSENTAEQKKTASDRVPSHLFTPQPATFTAMGKPAEPFQNKLTLTEEINPYTYRNFYNGGGVGLADFNQDGLLDIYLTGNRVPNALYINKGNFTFDEVAVQAGVACPNVWSTGVAIVDINADGWPDIYVCKAGPPADAAIADFKGVRHNELFINQQDGTFREAAAEYGLAISGLSVHAAFFDYDGDGDLDVYLLNNSNRSITGYDLKEGLRQLPDPTGGNRLLRCEQKADGQPIYVDVTQQAGIYASAIGFGLGVTVGDVNQDGWPDLFVSNDFFERDYLYFNQGDGTFCEALPDFLPEISLGSMGADFADLNNDALPELFVTEMLPRTDRRYKTKAAFPSWNRYQLYRDKGYHQQFSRNVLQYNRGGGLFSEVSRWAGVEATDWSWGALLFDADGDGWKDIFVANGNGKDLLDQDYINFDGNPEAIRKMLLEEKQSILALFDKIPSEPLVNGLFRNEGQLQFKEVAAAWGMDQPTFSNGAAYGDLDNDGDLDLVVNTINAPFLIYRNNSEQAQLLLALKGDQAANPAAIGAQAFAFIGEQRLYQELHPMRGFQSTVDARLHFGLGAAQRLDSLYIRWPSGKWEAFDSLSSRGVQNIIAGKGRAVVPLTLALTATLAPANLAINTTHKRAATTSSLQTPTQPLMRCSQSSLPAASQPRASSLRKEGLQQKGRYLTSTPLNSLVAHTEADFIDFNHDGLLFWSVTNEGPALAVGDVDGNGLPDFYQGGGKGAPGQLYLQLRPGQFQASAQATWEADRDSEDTDALFFDADGDGRLDLYVCSGSNEHDRTAMALMDRLYLNKGGGRWEKTTQLLPSNSRPVSSSCVAACDFDGDGDLDLFVGGRLRPQLYGVPTDSYLLENKGGGTFEMVQLPELKELGMVTAAVWTLLDEAEGYELIVVGEFMPITILSFAPNGHLRSKTQLPNSHGLWYAVAVVEWNGQKTIVGGNHGLNTRLQASPAAPLVLHVNDFDRNGQAEQLLCFTEGSALYPWALKDDLVKQLPPLRKSLLRYDQYAGKSLSDIFPTELLARSSISKVEQLASMLYHYRPGGHFEEEPLPMEAQLAPIYAIAVADINQDGQLDLLLGGNQTIVKPEMGTQAASFGQLLLRQAAGGFLAPSPSESGLLLRGSVRSIRPFGARQWLVARNGEQPLLVERQ